MKKKAKIKSREELLAIITEYFSPHFIIKHNPKLKQEAVDRAHMDRPGQYIHEGAGPQSDPVLQQGTNQMIFGVFMNRDGKTIEYDDDSRIMFILHEIGHMICTRQIYNFDKYSPDLYGWVNEMEKKDPRTYHWAVMEEMTTGFIGFIWQARLGIIWDCLYHDCTTEEVSQPLNFPNKFIDFSTTKDRLPKKLRKKLDENGKLWMACDADLSPMFRIVKREWEKETVGDVVLADPVFRSFGTYHHGLLGAVNDEGKVIGRLSPENVKRNADALLKLWKVVPAEHESFLRFFSL